MFSLFFETATVNYILPSHVELMKENSKNFCLHCTFIECYPYYACSKHEIALRF